MISIYTYVLILVYHGCNGSIARQKSENLKLDKTNSQECVSLCSQCTVSSSQHPQYQLKKSWNRCIGNCLGLSKSSPKLSSQGLPSMTRSESSRSELSGCLPNHDIRTQSPPLRIRNGHVYTALYNNFTILYNIVQLAWKHGSWDDGPSQSLPRAASPEILSASLW